MNRAYLYVCVLTICCVAALTHARPRSQAQAMNDVYARMVKPHLGQGFEASVKLTCDASVCNTPEINELLRTLATPPRGSNVSVEALMGIWSRLMKTGYFARVELTLTPVGQK